MNNAGLSIVKFTKKLKLIFLILLCMFTLACTKSNDKPPQLDTPLPQVHTGIYKSFDATFTFNGDGETVIIHLSDRYLDSLGNPPNNTEYIYTFTWYEFGEYRYDGSTNLVLYHEETKTSIDFSLSEASDFERISISFPIPDKEIQVLERISD